MNQGPYVVTTFCANQSGAIRWGGYRWVGYLGGNVHFVNKKGAPGFTTMHMAAFECHRDIVELLLSLEVDVDVLDYSGETPLANASHCPESSDLALLLLRQ